MALKIQKRRRRKEARTSEIMAAGLEIFAERAGVSKATIYL